MHVSYMLLFVLLILFAILLKLFKDYEDAFSVVAYTSMTVALQSHSFAYTTFLLTKNKERELALSSSIALLMNLVLVSLFAYVFHLQYYYLVLATWLSYALHALLCIYFARRTIVQNDNNSVIRIMNECFPLSILLPVVLLFIIATLDLRYFIPLPFFLYFILNRNVFEQVLFSAKKIIINPNIRLNLFLLITNIKKLLNKYLLYYI